MAKKITPNTALKFIRCDEIAECWDGVEDKLYEKLWAVTAKAPKSTSEAPDSFEGNVADMWSNFTKAEQKRLNELAELGDEGRMTAAMETKELATRKAKAAKFEEDRAASKELRKHPEVDASTLAVQQAAVALASGAETLSSTLLSSVQAHLSQKSNQEPNTRWAALRKAINAAVLDAQSQEVRDNIDMQKLPSTIKTLNSFIGKVYLSKPEDFFKAKTMHEVRKLYVSIPKPERSPSAGSNAKGDQKGAGAGVTDKTAEVKLPKVLADLAALWVNLNANGQQQSAMDLEQMLRDAAKDFAVRGTPQERKQSPTHDPAFADRAAKTKAKAKTKTKTTKGTTAANLKAAAAAAVPAAAMV